jgi:hypothetical protein
MWNVGSKNRKFIVNDFKAESIMALPFYLFLLIFVNLYLDLRCNVSRCYAYPMNIIGNAS